MDYRITGFDKALGQIQVTYTTISNPTGWVYAIDVPIVNGAFITGAELDEEIQARAPVWLIERTELVANTTNADALVALVVPTPTVVCEVPLATDPNTLNVVGGIPVMITGEANVTP